MKRYFRFFTIVAVVILIAYLWHLSYKKIAEKNTLAKQYMQVPVLELGNLEGGFELLNGLGRDINKVIIYFNTHCDFCQFELKELEKKVPEFENTEIILVSAEPLDSLREFNQDLEFDLYPNAGIYHCPYDTLQKYFGKLVAPTTFIYGADKILLKKFNGATRIDDMLDVILQSNADNENCLTDTLPNEQTTNF